MFDFFHSLMSDKRTAKIWMPLKGLLYALSLVYGAAIFGRKIFYRFRIFKAQKVPMKVISVGNLTLGGTGKTPFVIALAGILKEVLKKETCVLIRGYGWDEQAMLKKSLPDIPILVGENRIRAATRAIKLYGSNTAVLDDGFQYWELARDLDIVLVDARNPFGNGQLFPRGVLREPKSAIKRADCIVLTKANKTKLDVNTIKGELSNIKPGLIFLEAEHKPRSLYGVKARKEFELSEVRGKRVILLSSIGDPDYFEETVRDLDADVILHLRFPDHYNYRPKDMEKIKNACDEKQFDYLITTEKDAVKFTRLGLYMPEYPLMVLSIDMEITSGKENLIDRLNSLYIR